MTPQASLRGMAAARARWGSIAAGWQARFAAVALLAVLAAVLCACGGQPGASGSPAPGGSVVLSVNGEPVTPADIDAVRAEARLAGEDDAEKRARNEAVRRVLLRAEARRLGVKVDESAVAARISRLEEHAGGSQIFNATLERAAMSRQQLAAAVSHALLADSLGAAKFAVSRATEAEVRAFYRRNRDVLFTTAAAVRIGKVTLPTRSLAERVARRLRRGEAFADVARRFSMDPAAKESGGMLGWISVHTLPIEVRQALAEVPRGGVSDPVRSSGKWQVFGVFARRAARVKAFAAVAKEIEKELTRRRRAAALTRWARRAAAAATVVTAQ